MLRAGMIGLCLLALSWPLTAQGPAEAERHYRKGVELAQQGHLDEAIPAFRSALVILPDHKLILNGLGAALVGIGDFEAAEKFLARALELDPSLAAARKNLAVGLFQRGQHGEAEPHLEILAMDPNSRPLANLFLGMIEAQRGQPVRARDLLESAGTMIYQFPQAFLALARSQLESGRSADAAGTLDTFRDVKGAASADHVEAADLYSRVGRFESALRHLGIARDLDPELPQLDYRTAVVLASLGRGEQALALLKRSAARAPDSRSLNLLGLLAEEQDDLELAIQSLRKAISLEPRNEDHYLDLSLFCVKRGNFELGEEILRIGLSELPESYRLHIQLGAVLERAAKRDEAERVFRKAIAINAEHQLAIASLGSLQLFAGEVEAALGTLKNGVGAFPDDFYLRYLHGYALMQSLRTTGDSSAAARARREFEESLRLNGEFPDAHYEMGKILLGSDPVAARMHFESALRADPMDDASKYQLARLHLREGRTEEGRELMQEVRQQKAEALEAERRPRPGVVRGTGPRVIALE